jgi:hypothetical protein
LGLTTEGKNTRVMRQKLAYVCDEKTDAKGRRRNMGSKLK